MWEAGGVPHHGMRAKLKITAVIVISVLALAVNYALLECRRYESIQELEPTPQVEIEMRVAAFRATTQATRPASPHPLDDGF